MDPHSNPSSGGPALPKLQQRRSSISIDDIDGILSPQDAIWFIACCKGGGVPLSQALQVLKFGDPNTPIKARFAKLGLLESADSEREPDQLVVEPDEYAMLSHHLLASGKSLPPSPPCSPSSSRKDSPGQSA